MPFLRSILENAPESKYLCEKYSPYDRNGPVVVDYAIHTSNLLFLHVLCDKLPDRDVMERLLEAENRAMVAHIFGLSAAIIQMVYSPTPGFRGIKRLSARDGEYRI